ncbi:IS3 family transposase [Hymenobacter sp. BRD67]|nr:IS3 family transposase [Hymenobacter sp. BRD67]
MKRFTFIALHVHCWSVRQQCQLLGVSPSGYYAWCKRAPASAAGQALPAWQVAAQRVFTTHAGRYGQRRLRAQLRREGYAVGRQRLRGWLSASGLRALCTRLSTRPRAPPRLTRRPLPLLTNSLAGRRPRPPTKFGWAISPTWPWPRGSGRTWPAGAMPFPGAWWAGT